MTLGGLRLGGLKRSTFAVVLGGAVLLALLVGLFVVDAAGEGVIAARQRRVAETARDDFVAFARAEGLQPLARALDRIEAAPSRAPAGAFRYALYSQGRLVGGARLLKPSQVPAPGFSTVEIGAGPDSGRWQVLVQPMAAGGELLIFEDLGERAAFRRAILIAGGGALLAGLAVVLAVSLAFGDLMFRRARGIARAAESIAAGQFGARAPVTGSGDVFDHIAAALNAMLGRIEELMTGMRTVTDSLTHDLRSPLTRLRAALARAAAPGLPEAERVEAVESALGDTERLLATFAALVDIARAESGLSRETFAPVELTALIADIAELFGPLVEDAGQTLLVRVPDAPVTVKAHELLLRQALGNLVHNAAVHAGPGAVVTLALEPGEPVRLVVADTGPGVPEAARGSVQERFVRLDAARSTPGSGLGLAIAAACAKLHGGALVLDDNGPGLKVVLSLH